MSRKDRRETSRVYALAFMERGPEVMVWYSLLWGEWEGIVSGER